MNNKNTNIETQKKFFRFASSVVLVAVLATLFGVMWYMRLQMLMMQRFLSVGNYLMIGLYVVLTVLVINTFKGFAIGTGRISILTMSQAIAMGLVNILEFIIILLMTRIKALMWITLGYIIVLIVVDAFAVLAVTFLSTKLYRSIFPPFTILNIFGQYENDLVMKMNRRADKYRITGEMSCREPLDKIIKELENYDAVLVNDVPSEIRNDIVKACFATDKRVYFTPKISDILIKGSEEVNLFDTPLYLCKNVGMDGISARRFIFITKSFSYCPKMLSKVKGGKTFLYNFVLRNVTVSTANASTMVKTIMYAKVIHINALIRVIKSMIMNSSTFTNPIAIACDIVSIDILPVPIAKPLNVLITSTVSTT